MSASSSRRTVDGAVAGRMPVPDGCISVGVSWRNISKPIDIDLQCVVVDEQGVIIDCAYYNNLRVGESIIHSGDETMGGPWGVQEMVKAELPALPTTVSALLFVVAAYAGGSLEDVGDGSVHIFQGSGVQQMACYQLQRSEAGVDVVAALIRRKGWELHPLDWPAAHGHHFMDILPLLSNIIRSLLSVAPVKQAVAFAMDKGEVLDLPQDARGLTIGLGWDTDGGEVDLDVSAVLIDINGEDVEAVFFGNLESAQHGLVHSGDNLTGSGHGDREQIRVDLAQIGSSVDQVVFVVNICSPFKRFGDVTNPYCRVYDEAMCVELCRYSLTDAGSDNGLIIAKLSREVGDRWGFHAMGLPCNGRTYKDSLRQIKRAVAKSVSSQHRSQSPSIRAVLDVFKDARSAECCSVQ